MSIGLASRIDASQAADPPTSLWRWVARGFDHRSLAALFLLLTTGGSVGYRWSDLLDANSDLDWLLVAIWGWLATMICWRVSPRRDLLMIGVGFGGGATIEWWGTNTELWRYFTNERPPLWILPAWPAATIAIDRMGRLVHEVGRRLGDRLDWRPSMPLWRLGYFIVVPAFVGWMTTFLWPRIDLLSSQIVVGLMVIVAVFTLDPRQDLALFLAGTLMGLSLEYWGTSRACWTYYTQQVPPPVAVVAHGFAAVAFARCGDGIQAALARLSFELRRRSRSDRGPAPGE